MRYFDLPVNLPHAGTVAARLLHVLRRAPADKSARSRELVREMMVPLMPYGFAQEHQLGPEARAARDAVARLARELVSEIERGGFGEDRLGQCVRNLFECLGLGEEGARLSLLAGENPDSLQRP